MATGWICVLLACVGGADDSVAFLQINWMGIDLLVYSVYITIEGVMCDSIMLTF